MTTPLRRRVAALLADIRRDHPDIELSRQVAELERRLDEPLRVAVVGRVKAGKSTLLNALVGERLAPTDAGECTRIVTWYRDSHTYRVTLHPVDGHPVPVRFSRDDGAIEIDLAGRDATTVDHLEVEWPSRRLADTVLVDTPGLGSVVDEHSARTRRFLALDGGEVAGADAVVYLVRHLHGDDLDFLEAFHDDSVSRVGPVSTLAVLSRADEVGAGRPDAMTAARRVAARYRADERLRRLCRTVVPVAGLLAEGAATLTEAEYATVRTLAMLPPTVADELLLSVDRFVAERDDVTVSPEDRRQLLARIGVYGVRVAVRMVGVGGADTSAKLCADLLALSGIGELRSLLAGLFTARRDTLKARAVLSALEALLVTEAGPVADDIQGRIERIVADAHELVELDLLAAVRSGVLALRPEEVEEVERLLDDPARPVAVRLGCAPGQERDAAIDGAARWRRRAENPLLGREVADAARAIARSYEGLVAGPA